jgi:hypothetical protein
MRNYSIIKSGDEYVIQADEKGILKIASRRRAARLVSDAAELLVSDGPARIDQQAPPGQPDRTSP